jgi:hypothetical protein
LLRGLIGWLAPVAVLAACGGDAEPAADAGAPAIEIGSGDSAFEALVDGEDIFVVQGPQGGFHLLGSFAATGVEPGNPEMLGDPDNPTMTFRVLTGASRVDIVDANTFTQGLEPVAGTGGVGKVGRLVILDIADDAELDGVEIRFEVDITDVHGATASDARLLMAVPHPANL